MEIKNRSKFVCIKDVVMEGTGEVAYIKGNVYLSEQDKCITNEQLEVGHFWTDDTEIKEHFIPYSQLDKVYTKHTPLLESIYDKYEGKKAGVGIKVGHFDNVCGSETGYFCKTCLITGKEYEECGYTYLSEKAFIEFMDLGKYIGSLNGESEEMMNGWERLLKEGHRVQFKCPATLGEWVDCSEDHDFTPNSEFSDKIEYRLNHFQLSKAEVSEEVPDTFPSNWYLHLDSQEVDIKIIKDYLRGFKGINSNFITHVQGCLLGQDIMGDGSYQHWGDDKHYLEKKYNLVEISYQQFLENVYQKKEFAEEVPNYLKIAEEWSKEGEKEEVFNPKPYYDNSKGSLYKVATERGWSIYTFDVVKRLERGGKKDPLRQEIEKSIDVLKIWLNELEDER